MAKYKLRYSPLFYQGFTAIIDYLMLELKNEQAARSLVHDTELAIQKRLTRPLSVRPYPSMAHHTYPYRRIVIGNYLIFYVVIDDTMVVRRMLYGRGDLDKII